MGRVRWKLADYLEERGITPYRLAKAIGNESRAGTIYRLARRGKEPSRVDLPTLATVVEGLNAITGETVSFDDVLEYEPSPEDSEAEAESRAWLEAELTDSLPPYDWGDVDPQTVGRSVQYMPNVGLLVDDESSGS